MESYSFKDLIEGKSPISKKGKEGTSETLVRIIIPKIQRDYAQGRSGVKATDVRTLFTGSLLATLRTDVDDSIQLLDFVYGYSDENNNFIPLDGQQRLTTLFLLHWLILPNEKMSLLRRIEDQKSILSYETRPSATEFCQFLVELRKDSIAKSFDEKYRIEKDKKENERKMPILSDYIREMDDFRYSWNFDPTVDSMLRMLDALMEQLGTFEEISKINSSRLENIRFHITPLDKLKQGDDLYVKMNARGLELSDFDNTKSALEADLLEIENDKLKDNNEYTMTVLQEWKKGIDGNWIDFFWHHAGADDPQKELSYENILKIEDDLKTFILRLVILHWFKEFTETKSNEINKNKYVEKIIEIVSQAKSGRVLLNKHLVDYIAMRFEDNHSQQKSLCPKIDYERIINDFSGLLYRSNDDGTCFSVESFIENILFPAGKNTFLVIESMLGENFTYLNRLVLHGLLTFTKYFKADDIYLNEKLQRDLKTWMRFIRNLSLARNTNSPFDKAEDVKKALDGINELFYDFLSYIKSGGNSMSEFIISDASLLNSDNKKIFDLHIYQEEKEKEILRKDPEWDSILDEYENTGYLFGQLRAPLQWSKNDKTKFQDYADRLNNLLIEGEDGIHLYAALLLASDINQDNYPYKGENMAEHSLLTLNFDRDRSFKRYLREKINDDYAPALKKLLDIWIKDFNDIEGGEEFLNKLIISDKYQSKHTWKKQIAEFPEMISNWCYNRRMDFTNLENPYFIESKRHDKMWNVNLCYLKKKNYPSEEFELHNTKEDSKYKDSITHNGEKIVDGNNDIIIK